MDDDAYLPPRLYGSWSSRALCHNAISHLRRQTQRLARRDSRAQRVQAQALSAAARRLQKPCCIGMYGSRVVKGLRLKVLGRLIL